MGRGNVASVNRVLRKTGASLRKHGMVQEGDRIMVAVSGGKDSLSMLDILAQKQKRIPVDFEIKAVHVISDHDPDPERRKAILERAFGKMGVAASFVKARVKATDRRGKDVPDCFWCSWLRRSILFDMAAKEGYNKLAFGHNKDDIAQTILLNMLYSGNISGIRAVQPLFEGKLTIIRPLMNVEESELIDYARERELVLEFSSCPVEKDSKRARMKSLIEDLAEETPDVRSNIIRAPSRIREEYIPEVEDVQ